MSDPLLRLPTPLPVERADRPIMPVGRQLVDAGVIDHSTLLKALDLQGRIDAPLGSILVANGDADHSDVVRALSTQYAADAIDLDINPPSPNMAKALPARLCQRHCVLPWRWLGQTLLVATERPDLLPRLRAQMGANAPRMLPVIAQRQQIMSCITDLHGPALAAHALTRVPQELSSRTWSLASAWGVATAVMLFGLLGLGLIYAPYELVTGVVVISLVALVMTSLLKLAALVAYLLGGGQKQQAKPQAPLPQWRLPSISVLVPLYREENIADQLIKRLKKLTYPKALLEVILVLEAKDDTTRAALAKAKLPPWMFVVEVPDAGQIKTKPRALNYALDFCNGQIIGVWDAEDAPEPDQLEKVAAGFAHADPSTVCLQGVLDYFNARQNWLARCFTIEYAAWWRLVLPGVARLGFALPLGGTTLFFRRRALRALRGWDAHNVTEDADLGLRLARAGFRTELIPTVTMEEANCRPWAWVKQRSRWIKGYFITYCVHMRSPVRLFKQLGFKRFIGVQAMFLATVAQCVTLPVLWSFLLPTFGVPHPAVTYMGAWIMPPLIVLFVSCALLDLIINMRAVAGRAHRHLLPYTLTLPLYFPLAAIASYKALFELVSAPFFWDKTEHGHSP